MIRPRPGLQAFHNGAPVEFLYRVGAGVVNECWRVRPIFLEGSDRTVIFAPGDRLTPIHSQKNV